MNAQQHTETMLNWFSETGISAVDLAVRRHDSTMIWHRNSATLSLPLPWIRAENARRADIYIRPARGHSWPLVFLDDLPLRTARGISRKYGALAVHTSPMGGSHVWLKCSKALDEQQRCAAQRWLASRVPADKASISGEHLGRLAGFKNWKRDGVWVNVLSQPLVDRTWIPQFLQANPSDTTRNSRPKPAPVDTSPSAKEWGWVCGLLESGCSPDEVYRRLVKQARRRRGADAERYARRTLSRALSRI